MRNIATFSLILIVCVGCQPKPPTPTAGAGGFVVPNSVDLGKPIISLPDVAIATATKDGNWQIEYAFDGDTLSYAVITGPAPGEVPGHIHSGGDSAGHIWAYVDKPDGSQMSVSGTGRIFFFSGTNFMQCPQRISGRLFKAFVDGNRPDYSMSALLRFAKK